MLNIKDLVENRKQTIKKYNFGDNYLAIIRIGENVASNSYIKGKLKDCSENEIKVVMVDFGNNVKQEEVIKKINYLNSQNQCRGIIVELPLPINLNTDQIIKSIDLTKDIDGLNKESEYLPCTPKGVLSLLEDIQFNIKGKTVCILGKGKTSGLPLINLLLEQGATILSCNSNTRPEVRHDLLSISDVIISATGKPNLVTIDDLGWNLELIIDIGINKNENNKLVGDCDPELYNKFEYITPVPNGMGLYTRVSLLENFMQSCKKYGNL